MSASIVVREHTKIKICGLTRQQDVEVCVEAGVDALGFVFYPASKRCVTPERAAELSARLPAFVSTVALFVNPTRQDVERVITTARPSVLQFHGDEAADFCGDFGLPYLKAFRIGAPDLASAAQVAEVCLSFGQAAGWLFDSYTPAFGGSGQSFDYELLSQVQALGRQQRALILSGGLNTSTVQTAIRTLSPWAVDVSSGVEDPAGIKSAQKIRAFVRAVRVAGA